LQHGNCRNYVMIKSFKEGTLHWCFGWQILKVNVFCNLLDLRRILGLPSIFGLMLTVNFVVSKLLNS
jgi:hypothetical protein